ncbi:MAG: Tim44/TimA family putative adaptor protein [Alphaproteobacteria bacterium]
MSADLIVYGVIAAGLVFWLRSILGTRHGEERERPSSLAGTGEIASDLPEEKQAMQEHALSGSERIQDLAQNPKGAFSIENKTAENGLIAIARAEKDFDIDFFGEACQDVFVMVVEAFARGEREALEDLLREDVYKAFEAAISEREASGETLESEIHAIKKAQVISAMVEGKTSYITVRFVAEETRVCRDKEGEIISGNPDRVSEMIDIWTFAHDVSGRDPRWLLIETRSEDPEQDNDLVPDTKID